MSANWTAPAPTLARGRKYDMENRLGKNGKLFAMMILLATSACASATAGSSRYRLVTDPGPRGTTHATEVEPTATSPVGDARSCAAQGRTWERARYRLVSTPGPRGMTRSVRVRETQCR